MRAPRQPGIKRYYYRGIAFSVEDCRYEPVCAVDQDLAANPYLATLYFARNDCDILGNFASLEEAEEAARDAIDELGRCVVL